MPLLDRQASITPQRGMPVEDRNSSAGIATAPSETVQFYYSNSGARTIDAGQAAGTFVVGVLALHPVMNSEGSMQATNLDTSLSFTSTALTTEVPFPFIVGENSDEVTWASRLSFISEYLTTNGQYCVDYAKGIIYGRKASTQVTLTSATYKVQSRSTSSNPTYVVAPSGTPTLSNVSVAATSFTALAANANRKGVIIYNDGTANVYIKFGATASTSSFTYKMLANNTLTIPEPNAPIYTGIIDAIGDSATGTLRVTEIV